MKLDEIKAKSDDALKRDLAHAREELRDLRFQVAQNQQKDVRKVREKKKEIAQMLTVLSSRKSKQAK